MSTALINGIPLRYEAHGQGFPLVLAHGYTASLEMWEAQVEPFAERYRLLLYDCRGHGGSGAPQDPSLYSMDTLAEDLRGLLQHLGLQEAFVGGMSMGGVIALHFALAYPQMVRALLLFDTVPGGPFLRKFIPPRDAEGVMASLEAGGLPGCVHMGRAMFDSPDYSPRLGELTMPLLLVAGEWDPMSEAVEEMHRQVPHSRYVLLREAGHGSSAWRPAAFNQAVLDFLAAVERGEPVAGRVVL